MSIKKYNKSVSIKQNNSLDSCKPYIASSVLFLLVSVIITGAKPYIASSVLFLLVSVVITGAFIYFYVNSQSNRKLQDYYQKKK